MSDCEAYLPEVLDDFIILGVSTIIGVLLPVIHINISDTANQQLELPFVKDIDKVWRYQLIESSYECLELLVNTFLDPPLGNKPGTN